MENLPKITKKILFFLPFYFMVQFIVSQENFFVYMVKGEPFIKINDSVKSVKKGSILNKSTIVTVNKNDELHYINDKGNIFKLNNTGNYSFSDLQKIPAVKDEKSFVKKYFSYMWKEFTNNIDTNSNKSGVVYRGDEIVLMKYPFDSIKIYYSEINFEWDLVEDKTKEYYFILKNMDTNQITKIGTLGTSISLFVDGSILKERGNYEWAISETKYPNFNKMVFYSFKILSQEEFKEIEKEVKSISKFLKGLGLSKKEVKKAICGDYKICF